MADLPSPIPTILTASTVVLIVLGVAVLGSFVWVIVGDLRRDVRSRYSWRTISMSQLPFTEAWRSSIDPSDLLAFVRNRRRRHVFLSLGVLLLWSVTGYGYLHAVVDAYQCHTSLLWQPTRQAIPQVPRPQSDPSR